VTDSSSDREARVTEYRRQVTAAADALAAAIRTEVADGGEVVSHMLATVAANLGGMHKLTEKRPGSWEADYVDRFLGSTVGPHGKYLLEYRTEPIEVVACVPAMLADLDIDGLYDDSALLIGQAETAVLGPDPDDAAAAALAARLEHIERLILQLREVDYAAYRQAFEEQLRVAGRYLFDQEHLSEDVSVSIRFVDWPQCEEATGAREDFGSIEYRLWETARANTAPPGFTEPLSQLRGQLDDLLRQSGHLPHQRIPELAHYGREEEGEHRPRVSQT
jgi:hypothetical protein